MNDPRISEVIDDILKTNDGRKTDVARGLLFNDQVPFVEEYVNTTHGPTHTGYTMKVEAVYDIERPGTFKGPVTNHKLLFHGTPKENLYYLLRDGYKKAILTDKAAFGKGIYFTNCASKAANLLNPKAKDAPEQADLGEINPPEGTQYLILAEVALGKSKETTKSEKTISKFMQDATSVYGKGIHRPTEKFEYPDTVPIEVGMELRKDDSTTSEFQYDEYVVFNAEQVKHKYLVKITVIPKEIST